MRTRAVPELLLGLLASTIHDAKHAHDTITITGSARKPIRSDLVQWHLVSATFAVAS